MRLSRKEGHHYNCGKHPRDLEGILANPESNVRHRQRDHDLSPGSGPRLSKQQAKVSDLEGGVLAMIIPFEHE